MLRLGSEPHGVQIHAVAEMMGTAMASESCRNGSPTGEAAFVEAGEEEIDAGDQSATEAAAGRGPRATLRSHSLEHAWTFWFDNPSAKSKHAAWGSSIRPVHTFATVEDFWGLYNNINRPSKLAIGADFHCFKDKIEPKWEDPVCSNGGKWTINCSRGKVDKWWLYTLLAMLGEQFDHGDEICGAVVNVRAKQEKISIWTKNALNESSQISIGRQWKEFLDYNDTVGFILHDDAKKHDRFAKSRYHA
ncbi:Eukaryotic translation initiation factor 4E-1 [Apostasia shenzhenica]|uniref:eIF-4F 25 kDa subunit n=1 Tax=Apostasia shenzhenica TaxID=1088818 RepID=A0A2I0AF27_9ASPA|nr:Eukaryotic translation initiation factor 4E-1 [Apostasia shenzhenica]